MGSVGNENALVHGAHSEARIRPIARAEKRRFLARTGLRASELSGPQAAYLQSWATCTAKIRQIDLWLAEHDALIGPDGRPAPVLAFYTSLQNAAQRAMSRLEASLRDTRPDPAAALRDYLNLVEDDGADDETSVA
jgi:hypothetical protein